MGALRSFFVGMGAVRPFSYFGGTFMTRKSRQITLGAMIGALYLTLCHAQNLLLPESTSFAIQFRAAEALCVLAFFTPAAVSGLTVGCFLYNLTFAGALPLDMLVGSVATFLATGSMWILRKHRFLGLFMPALWNALLVGWELDVYIGGGFLLNALYVAIGEAAVLLTLGALLERILHRPHLRRWFAN
jgi:uncharacterized membrane protein